MKGPPAGWARELAEAAADEAKREAEKRAAAAAARRNERNPGDKLPALAESLLAEGRAAALNVARAAFRHPVAYSFPRFLMGAAVKTTNRLKDPDLSTAYLRRRVEGRTHGFYTGSPAPGFTIENAFRELGQRDFEGAVGAARNLEDRHLRATAIMALSAACLEESAKPAKPAGRKAPATKNTRTDRNAPPTKKPKQPEPPRP